MKKELIFHLNRMADEHEALARAYRAVANDTINGQPDEPKKKKRTTKNYKLPAPPVTRNYNGKHWMQQPKNKARMMKVIRKMQKAKRAARG